MAAAAAWRCRAAPGPARSARAGLLCCSAPTAFFSSLFFFFPFFVIFQAPTGGLLGGGARGRAGGGRGAGCAAARGRRCHRPARARRPRLLARGGGGGGAPPPPPPKRGPGGGGGGRGGGGGGGPGGEGSGAGVARRLLWPIKARLRLRGAHIPSTRLTNNPLLFSSFFLLLFCWTTMVQEQHFGTHPAFGTSTMAVTTRDDHIHRVCPARRKKMGEEKKKEKENPWLLVYSLAAFCLCGSLLSLFWYAGQALGAGTFSCSIFFLFFLFDVFFCNQNIEWSCFLDSLIFFLSSSSSSSSSSFFFFFLG